MILNQNSMEKEFVTYPLALRMKELGYDEPCMAWYGGEDIFRISGNYKNSTHTIWFCVSAPTWQSAFAWFREKYNIHIRIEKYDETKWWANWGSWTSDVYDLYEETELACLEKLIEIVEQKQPCSTL